MKKTTVLCMAASLLYFAALGQKKDTKKDSQAIISLAEVATLAVIQRNAGKECVPASELSLLKWLHDQDGEFSRAARSYKPKNKNDLVMARLCPCPPLWCPCDSTRWATGVLELWKVKFELLGDPEKDLPTIPFTQGPLQNKMAELKSSENLVDGVWTVRFSMVVGNKTEEFELPAMSKDGVLYLGK